MTDQDQPPTSPQTPSNRQLHDAIAGALQQQGMTYSGIQQAVRDVQALYAAPLPRLSNETVDVREISDEDMRRLLSAKDVGAGRGKLKRILAALSRPDRGDGT